MNNVKKRIEYIDIAKAIALFFVVLGHLVENNSKTFNWIFSFHMPLFFILTGMCLNIEKYNNIFIYIKRKAKELVLPFCIFSIIGFVVSCFVYSWKRKITIKRFIINCLYQTQPEVFHVGQLWFLIALFVACIFFYIIERYVVKDRTKLFSLFTYFIISIIGFNILALLKNPSIISLPYDFERLPFKLDSAITIVVFLKMGNIIKRNNIIENIAKLSNIKLVILLIILLGTNILLGTVLNGYVNICSCVFGSYINYYVSSITGSIFIILIAYKIGHNKILCYYGRNTLPMFALHSLFIAIVAYITSLIFNKNYVPLQNISILMCIVLSFIIYILLFLVAVIYNFITKYIRQYKIVKIDIDKDVKV